MVFLGIDWGKIFSFSFWLEVSPGELSVMFERLFLAVLIINYGAFAVSKYLNKKLISQKSFIKAIFWQKFSGFCLTMAVSFSFIFFFRYEAIPVLGGRFWVFIWLVCGFVWFIYLMKYYFTVIPKQLAELEERKKGNQYLVKKKKRK